MKKRIVTAGAIVLAGAGLFVFAQNWQQIREFLTGYEEVPSVSTEADGVFRARISHDGNSIQYQLSYNELEGTITQAHIHFGQKGVNGVIIVWLCGTASNPGPAGTPPCPQSGTVTGTITAANVVGQPLHANGNAGQGIQPGEWEEFLRALRAGKTYVNVHSTKFPGGEIRSQLDGDRGHHDELHKGDEQ